MLAVFYVGNLCRWKHCLYLIWLDILCNREYLIRWVCRKYCLRIKIRQLVRGRTSFVRDVKLGSLTVSVEVVIQAVLTTCLCWTCWRTAFHNIDVICDRNTVAETVQQELLYVGDEHGKLLAIRDIIRKVRLVCLTDFSWTLLLADGHIVSV